MNKQAAAEKGVLEYFTKQANKRKISLDEAKRYINNISFTTALEELRDCDVVIEAVFEQMEVKKKVFASLDNIVKPHAVLATNTSSLDIDLSERDALFREAAEVIVTAQQGSASLLQRKLKLGYNRAGRIIDQMEAAGVVGPFEGSKARQVLINDLASLNRLFDDDKL